MRYNACMWVRCRPATVLQCSTINTNMNMNEQSYPYDPGDIDYSDVFRDFPIQDTYCIHGHACDHDIFSTFKYEKLLMAVGSAYVSRDQLRRAIHPYTNPTESDWLTICKEFGIDRLKDEIYLPLTDLSPEELLEIQLTDWNHSSHQYSCIDTNSYYYKSLYTPVKDIISIDDWVAALNLHSRL